MDIIKSIKEMQGWSEARRRQGDTIAFTPTMGYLHEGHLSLIREARNHADRVVVSVFVNPTQFGPGEDFNTYPRDLERDFQLAGSAGADILFTPNTWEFYPAGFDTYIEQEKLPGHLCGLSRPGHFRGVMTIVTKLFHVVNPHVAVFGEKDFQQLAVIRRMVADLNFNIRIIGHPIVREPDGLAMSSRNTKLSSKERGAAVCLSQALDQAKKRVREGETRSRMLMGIVEETISAQPEARIDYIRICDPDTLDDVSTVHQPALLALAVNIGQVRLIDNAILSPG